MFNKLILGRDELDEFECLFLREKLIKSYHADSGLSPYLFDESIKYAKSNRIKDKQSLLIALMLFEKIDSTFPSEYDFSFLFEEGIIEESYCINKGTTNDSQTSKILDGMWKLTEGIIDKICDAMECVLQQFDITIYIRNYLSEDDIITLCSVFWYNTEETFLDEFVKVLIYVADEFTRVKIVQSYGHEIDIDKMLKSDSNFRFEARSKARQIYKLKNSLINEQVETFTYYTNLLDSCTESYSFSADCKSCSIKKCNICSKFTEFYSYMNMDKSSEDIGVERLSQLNGLIKSQTENGSLFDNSIKFKIQPFQMDKLEKINDVYQIVNIDMSSELSSLPVPSSVKEALRLRENPNMKSYRDVFTKWLDCMYNGNINEAEYIKKDFDAANAFFKKKQLSDKKKTSLLRCSFIALINQIPYLSNIIGLVSPFTARKAILDEEKYKWIHLTR